MYKLLLSLDPCVFLDLQALLSRADLRVKELRQSLDRLTAESEKLEVSFFFSMSVITV